MTHYFDTSFKMNHHYQRASFSLIDNLIAILFVNFIHKGFINDDQNNFMSSLELLIYLIVIPLIISIFQYYKLSSMTLIGKYRLVKSDNSELSFFNFYFRNFFKLPIVFGYVFIPLLWIIFPLLKYENKDLTPFDEIFKTKIIVTDKDKSSKRKTTFGIERNFKLNTNRISLLLISYKQSTFTNFKTLKQYLINNWSKPRILAIYILWVSIHFFLLLFSEKYTINNDNVLYYYRKGIDNWSTNETLFFPFERCKEYIYLGVYDRTEFITYCLIPIVIYFAFFLWKKKQ